MKKLLYVILTFLITVHFGCKKEWLEKKRDSKLIVPTTLDDIRLLMNNSAPMSSLGSDYLGVGEIAAGDLYIDDESYRSSNPYERKLYSSWMENPYRNVPIVYEWDGGYQQIQICNVAIEALDKISINSGNISEWSDLKGNALFFRGKAIFNLAQIFAPPYSDNNLNKPGIPLRTNSDINVEIKRSTVFDTYEFILNELKSAVKLVNKVPRFKSDASKPAVYGLISRCYLSMDDYNKAGLYADSCLQIYDKLLDYNSLDPNAYNTFPMFNDEVISESGLAANYSLFYSPIGKIQNEVMESYNSNDLRKSLYFTLNEDNSFSMTKFYYGFRQAFSGIATDEIYLIRSECFARQGKNIEAMKDLNILLEKRFKTGTFIPLSATNSASVLKIILKERRKELLIRGLRWSDLRRLNQDVETAVSLHRMIEGKDYSLPPNDPKYTFPLPDYVINEYKVEQNPGW